ncbi:Hypothetical protein SMAX5B_015682 [Scophthalmus maximus]|uniref:Uncharacterized protein n=1 Tax=Scophthalmus maximus TaxID=52904 RepID=A0A2U9D3R6_SCOMX|nr:Hypothetical protein SMAX5B_015682 [Scophthalmus maximus]
MRKIFTSTHAHSTSYTITLSAIVIYFSPQPYSCTFTIAVVRIDDNGDFVFCENACNGILVTFGYLAL